MVSERTWYIPCACGDSWHGLLLRQWPVDAPDAWLLTLVFHTDRYTLGQRLRLAWDVLRGRLEYHEIVLYRSELTQLHMACVDAAMCAEEEA